MGWNDIGYHNPHVKTPNLDQLAYSGIRLESLYTLPLCTPSRSALLTGRYPFTIGMQRYVLQSGSPYCLPRDLTLLPQVLKSANYSTHIVGKWHLGGCNSSCFPTARGFDTFFGSLSGFQNHYSKENSEYRYLPLYDMWNGTTQYVDRSTYMMDLLSQRALQIISSHERDRPLFLYLPTPLVHSPLQVPRKYEELYAHIEDRDRGVYLGMVTALDDFVGAIVSGLKDAGLYENSIIVFQSDNGAQSAGLTAVLPEMSGSNFPLRGGKSSLHEGGTRVVGFMHSPLRVPATTYSGLMHMVDWYPTLLDFAGLSLDGREGLLDGVSHYKSITSGGEHPRSEFVYSMGYGLWADEVDTITAAIRVKDYKLIIGSQGSPVEAAHLWTLPSELSGGSPITGDSCISNQTTSGCLFNLRDDPFEQHNLYNRFPEVVANLRARLEYYKSRLQPSLHLPRLPYERVQQDGMLSATFC